MKIKELILETASLQRTRLFYHKTLELDIIEENEYQIAFKAGNTRLVFRQATAGKPFYHFAFNIINNKFSDSFEWLNNKLDILPAGENGIPIAAYNNWNAQSFYFLDNNANIVEFIVRFDLPYHSNQPFSSDCIKEISEIGLVVADVAGKAAELHEAYGIPYFKKGPRLDDFITMGDDEGLLLIVREKRGWVPTNRPSQAFPITVTDADGHIIRLE